MPETVASLKGTIELDSSNYKKGIEEAKKATQGLNTLLADAEARFRATGSEEARATLSCDAHMKAEKRLAEEIKRTGSALLQETAYLKEMAAAEARLTAIHQGESRAVQDVAAKYHELSAAERQQLVATQGAIAAHEAQEKALAKLGAEAERMPQRLRTMGRAMGQVGREMTQTLTVPILALGAGILKAGVDVDKGMDAIRLSTGATGERLKGLQTDFKAVAGTVPNSMADVGRALGMVATRTGLVGPPLQALTRQLLTVSRLTKTDLNETLRQSTRVFGDWGIKVAQQGPALDMLFRASEQTGIGFAKLEEALVRSGAPLRQMGFSFGEAAVLIGKFEKEGVRTDLVLGSLRIALTRMAKAGVTDAHQALLQIISSIKGAGTAAQATAIAVKVFGAKAGPDMAAAIREGRFELGKLFDTVTKGQDTIAKAAQNTDDFGEKFAKLRNRVELALDPVGSKLMSALNRLGDWLIRQVPNLTALIETFNKLSPAAQGATVAVLAIVAGAGPALIGIGKLVQAWGALSLVMKSAEAQAILTWIAVQGPEIGAILLIIGGVATAWNTNFLHIRDGMQKFGEDIAHLVEFAKTKFQQLGTAWAEAQHRLGLDKPGPSLTGMQSSAGAARDRLAKIGPIPTQGLFTGLGMEDARRRGFAGGRTSLPPVLPLVTTPSGRSTGTTGPMDPALAALLDAHKKENDRIEKIMAQARRTALGAGREKGDFATAEQQAALKLYTKDFDDLSAAQKKVADQLARIVVGGEKAAAAQAAHRKALQEHTAATKEAIHHAAILNAQTIDMQRQIEGGAARTHAAQAAVLHPKADPNARAAEAAAQADFDRTKARLTAINKLRAEIDAVDKKIREKRPVALIGPPAPLTAFDDPKAAALDRRLAEHTGWLKKIEAADHAAAKAKAEHATEVKKFSDLVDTLNAQYRELTQVEQTPSALLARLPRGVLAPDVQENINKARQQSIINEAVKATNEQNAKAEEALANAKAQVTAETDRLNGATSTEANLAEQLFRHINILNPAMVDAANNILDQAKANGVLEQSQKDAAKATREKEKIDALLANTMADLSAEYDTLTGKQPEQTRAINRLARDTSKLTDEQRKQLKEVQAMFKRRDLMKGVAEFAEGMEGIFQNAFEGLSHGFKGFFSSIYQGFKQLLVKMAAEYLASQLKNLILKGLGSLVSGAYGGGGAAGGGGGSAALSGGSGILRDLLNLSGGIPTASGGTVPIMSGGGLDTGALTISSASRRQPALAGAGAGGGGHTIIVNVQGEHLPQARRNAGAMAQQIGRELNRQQRRSGNG